MIKAQYVEFPVKDVARAAAFYAAVFELTPGDTWDDGTRKVIVLNDGQNGTGVSLNENPSAQNFTPGDSGALVYFEAGSDVAAYVKRVKEAGGTVVEDRTLMGGDYYYAIVKDTEGNQFALSAKEENADSSANS